MKSFKELLPEAYEKRLYRLDIAAPKAQAAVEKKFGTSSFEELGDKGHVEYDVPENPHDREKNPKEWEKWEMSDAAEPTLGAKTAPEIKRFSGILDAKFAAQRGLDRRDVQIADNLKTSNPNLYRTYISRAKEDVLPRHDTQLRHIENRIKWYDKHLDQLKNMNAPEMVVQSAKKAQQDVRNSFDSIGQVMQQDLHKRIGQLHAETLKSINDPNYK